MSLTIQYIIIAIIFSAALLYVIGKFIPSKNNKKSCGSCCGCDTTASRKT